MITDETFLQTSGGIEINSLNNVLDSNDLENNDNEHIQLIGHSSYYDKTKFENLIQSPQKCFSILSSNIQGISAKFDELKIFIEEIHEKFNFEFSAICLQECQVKENDLNLLSNYTLNNYHMFPQGYPRKPCSTKGGLIVYINEAFKGTQIKSLNTFSTWEGQIIKVSDGALQRPINIVNVYRAPKVKNDDYYQFIQELNPLLPSLENENSECIISGDFNIDLLKIHDKVAFSEFFDLMTENSFYPKITLPTALKY